MGRILATTRVEKPWGMTDLPPAFGDTAGKCLGEIWFDPQPPLTHIMAKYLFTSQKLSVQVHPSASDAARMGLGSSGKEECWLVLDAQPGAAVALGLDGDYDAAEVYAAARDGSIETMLAWHDARVGDFFHVPPGTIHAIGAGLTLLEIQQNTDITFRLFDYGRPRDLHLDQAMECAHLRPHDPAQRTHAGSDASEELLACGAFTVALHRGAHCHIAQQPELAIPLQGEMSICGQPATHGSCFAMSPGDELRSEPDARFVVVQAPVANA